jgi:hypothetical protein
MIGKLETNWTVRKDDLAYDTPVSVILYKDNEETSINIRLTNPFKNPHGEDDDLNILIPFDEFMFAFAKNISQELVSNGG